MEVNIQLFLLCRFTEDNDYDVFGWPYTILAIRIVSITRK